MHQDSHVHLVCMHGLFLSTRDFFIVLVLEC